MSRTPQNGREDEPMTTDKRTRTPQKPVWTDPETHDLLAKLAAEDQRTLVGELRWLLVRELHRRKRRTSSPAPGTDGLT